MQVSVETLSALERRLTVGVPSAAIETEVNQRLQKLARTQRIDGFRPGKAPLSVIQKRFGGYVRQEVIGDVIQRHFYEAVVQEKLNPAGAPSITLKGETPEQLEFEATFEVYPEVKVAGLDTLEVEKVVAEVGDADLDKMLETLRKQRGVWKDVERAAADGDRLSIDFVGKIDGEVFDGGSSKGFNLVLGSKSMIPGFEDGLMGKSAGDAVELNVNFPEDYHHAPVAGKPAQFAVTVNTVQALELPALDEKFASLFNVDTIDALRAEVGKNMQRELANVLKNKVKAQVLDGLAKANTMDIPKALLVNEIHALREQAANQFRGGRGGKLPELPDALFEEQAKRRVTLGLVMAELIKQFELKADEDKVRSTIENLASAYENPEEVVNWYYANRDQLSNIESLVLEDTVVEKVAAGAKLTEKPSSFDEVMNPTRSA
ncbi:MAG: trigger factor [Gammaproteobacteria bacterium]|nr:trigger factor [Gammaproteobacteria bacterium]